LILNIVISDFPVSGTSYNFNVKKYNDDTIYRATAKFIKGISTPLIITKPIAYSVNDSTGQFVWTLSDPSQNALIDFVNISIYANGSPSFHYNQSIDKENASQDLTSYNANINYTNRAPHNLYLSVSDNNDNRAYANIVYFPLPGDGSISGQFTFNTNSTNAESLNNKKIYLYLTTWANNAEITTDSQMFTLNLNALNVSNNFNYSFNNLFYTNYSLKTFIDLNDNNQYDAGEPNYSLGNYVIEEANKNVTTNPQYNFSKVETPIISNLNYSQYANDTTITITFNATNSGNNYLMDTLYYKITGDVTDADEWKTYSASSAQCNLSIGDGAKNLLLQVKDWFGNSTSNPIAITLDKTAPVINSFILNANNTLTNTTYLQLTFNVSDVNLQDTIIITGDLTNAAQITNSSPQQIILTTGDGVKTITARFQDLAGNISETSATITLDQTGPTFNFTPVTWADTTQAINLQFTVSDQRYIKGVALHYIEMDSTADFNNVQIITLTPSGQSIEYSDTFTIPARNATIADSGFVYYYLAVSDTLDNVKYYIISGETTVSPSQISQFVKLQRIDYSAPEISIVQAPLTNSNNCTVVINKLSITGIGLATGRIYGDIENQVNITDTNIMTYAVSLTNTNGIKTIYCEYVDIEGNTSPAGSATIFFDNTAPNISLQIGSADITNFTQQVVTFSYSDSTDRKDTIEILASSDVLTAYKGEIAITSGNQFNIELTAGDGIKTISIKVYDSAGNYTTVNDTIILDQTGPSFTFTPVTWADTTQAINLQFSVTDVYSNIGEVNLYYVDIDSAAILDNLIEISKTANNSKTLTDTFTIPARSANSLDSGLVYYGLEAIDVLGNTTYYLLAGETVTQVNNINQFIVLKRQDITPLSVNPLSYTVDTTINSRTVIFTGSFGNIGALNTLQVYNSESGNTTTVFSNTDTTVFSQQITFTSDGIKTIIFTASSVNNEPPKNSAKITFNIDVTAPNLQIISPASGIVIDTDNISVIGKLNHTPANDTAKIVLNNQDTFYVTLGLPADTFTCAVSNLQANTNTLKIIATDFVGNETYINLLVYYNNDTSIKIINTTIDSAAPIVIIEDTTAVIVNAVLANNNQAPNTAVLNIATANNATIELNLTFSDTSLPINVSIKTAEDTTVKQKIEASEQVKQTVKKFGTDADYSAGLQTVRKFDFIQNNQSINNNVSCTITFNLPLQLQNKYVSVYWFNETQNEWQALADTQIISRQSDKIIARLTHFSIYGVFSAGAPVQTTMDNIVIFPNPFKPNDGNPATGAEFSGALNAGNMTGIHIIGLPANAKIKIYDILGQLVDECEPLTNQGMVIWDAYNKKGEKVASGVYLVVIESPLGKKVKKLAIIR